MGPSIEFMVAKHKVWNILLEKNRWKISDWIFQDFKSIFTLKFDRLRL